MPTTITIANQASQTLAFVEKVKESHLAEDTTSTKSQRVLTSKEEEFKEMLLQGLREMKAIREGKMKAGNLDDLLDELD
ncbi:hypothetical protein [uncultured Capnocytophaga sp.]|uniref:hypothetical protein n=1 Tax=uncultured Capnocytophaga sp. TaxID=159273 RepID=UPI002628798B|nr:hypothetical protein [uncultured Capnocytophaga sp.]